MQQARSTERVCGSVDHTLASNPMRGSAIAHVNPDTGNTLELVGEVWTDGDGTQFPLTNGAWRFVSDAPNYADSFGFQWNEFSKTQIDSPHAARATRSRLWATTAWTPEDLAGRAVLEVGSGAGRFTRELLTSSEAEVYSVDYSSAVEANFRNNGPHERLHLYQASVYALPFKPQQFDYVLSLGVLQHTPDFRASIEALAAMVKPGGKLVVDFYCMRGWWTKVSAKYALRPITKRLTHRRLLWLIEHNVDWMMALNGFNKKLGLSVLNRFIPLCDFGGTLPPDLPDNELREWVVLDTFDMFSATHDHPQRLQTVTDWVKETGLVDVEALQVEYGPAKAAAVRASRALSVRATPAPQTLHVAHRGNEVE